MEEVTKIKKIFVQDLNTKKKNGVKGPRDGGGGGSESLEGEF